MKLIKCPLRINLNYSCGELTFILTTCFAEGRHQQQRIGNSNQVTDQQLPQPVVSSVIQFHMPVKCCEHKTSSASRSAQYHSHCTSFSTVTAPASLTAFATLLLCFTSVTFFANETKVLVTRISANYILFHVLRQRVFQIKHVLERPPSFSGPN